MLIHSELVESIDELKKTLVAQQEQLSALNERLRAIERLMNRSRPMSQ